MKNLKKMLAVFAASAVMCAAVPAFAEVEVTGAFDKTAVTADYSELLTENKMAATVDLEEAAAGTEMTFLILDADAEDNAEEDENGKTYLESDILHIDQQTLTAQSNGNKFECVIDANRITGSDGETIPQTEGEKGYLVRVGYYDKSGNFQIAKATMLIADNAGEDEPETITIVWGDVGLEGDANSVDAATVMNAVAGLTTSWNLEQKGVVYTFTFGSDIVTANEKSYAMTAGETSIVWGDVGLEGDANSVDAATVMNAVAGLTTSWSLDSGDNTEFGEELEITLVEQKQ